MPDLTCEDIYRIARLSRLAVSDGEIEGYREELGVVLGYVQRLIELDLAKVEPLTHVGEGAGKSLGGGSEPDSQKTSRPNSQANRLAADEPGPVLANDLVMGLAQGAEPPYFSVPGVLKSDTSEGTGA